MKIIVGTPRSGTTFLTRWIHNENPTHAYLGEYFQPYYYPTGEDPYLVTTHRLSSLADLSVFKVHTGDELDQRVWDLLATKPVIIIRRRNILDQILSFGIANLNDIWVMYEGVQQYAYGTYERKWFDYLVCRLRELDDRSKHLLIADEVYYEDLSLYPINGVLPIKQNDISLDEKLNIFSNADEILRWYSEIAHV